jgi:hypothetical protein
MTRPTFALHAADGIIVRSETIPRPVRALWSAPVARLRRLLDGDPARLAQLARLADAIRAGDYSIDVQTIADRMLANLIHGRRH